MNIIKMIAVSFLGSLLFIGVSVKAATIPFNTLVSGATSFAYDGDGDTIDDVIFSTTDPGGFNTAGPGPNQSFINEPGLEGTANLSVDLRVDFLNGAITNLSFGFAQSTTAGGVEGVHFSVFNSSDGLLAETNVLSDFTQPDGTNPSDFPEGLVSLAFTGIAAYALFDFSDGSSADRYIIDDFTGTFGSSENIPEVPVPAALWLFGTALIGLVGFNKRRKAA